MTNRKKPFGKWFNLPSRRLHGCDNAGNPVAPLSDVGEYRDKDGRLVVEVDEMEPEIQEQLDRILKDVPVIADPK